MAAELRDPCGGGQRAYAVEVRQHDARMARANVFVRCLHELAARCPAPIRQMAAFILGARADIEPIDAAMVLTSDEVSQRGRVDAAYACCLGHAFSTLTRIA